jgi:hypothetical protein
MNIISSRFSTIEKAEEYIEMNYIWMLKDRNISILPVYDFITDVTEIRAYKLKRLKKIIYRS